MSTLKLNDDTEIFYTDSGKGEPVVLIHGWPLNSDMWEYQNLALREQGFRVIAYDRRGFGRSSRAAIGYDYNTLSADLNALMENLDIRGATLVGFSMGGGEVARYLGRFGVQRVARAVLISSVVPMLMQSVDNPEGVPVDVFDDMIASLREDRPRFLASFAKTFFGVGLLSAPVSEETLQWINYLAFQAGLGATIECVRAFSETDFRADLASFSLPTLVIHGDADKIVPMGSTGEAAARGIQGATFKSYQGAPHGLFLTNKEQLIGDLSAFLSSKGAMEDTVGMRTA